MIEKETPPINEVESILKRYPEPVPDELKCRRTMSQFRNQVLNFKNEDDFIAFILDLENLFHRPFVNFPYHENVHNLEILEFQKWIARIAFNTFDLSGLWFIDINFGWDRHGSYEDYRIIQIGTDVIKDGKELTTKVVQFELERQDHGVYLDQADSENINKNDVNYLERKDRFFFLIEAVRELGFE